MSPPGPPLLPDAPPGLPLRTVPLPAGPARGLHPLADGRVAVRTDEALLALAPRSGELTSIGPPAASVAAGPFGLAWADAERTFVGARAFEGGGALAATDDGALLRLEPAGRLARLADPMDDAGAASFEGIAEGVTALSKDPTIHGVEGGLLLRGERLPLPFTPRFLALSPRGDELLVQGWRTGLRLALGSGARHPLRGGARQHAGRAYLAGGLFDGRHRLRARPVDAACIQGPFLVEAGPHALHVHDLDALLAAPARPGPRERVEQLAASPSGRRLAARAPGEIVVWGDDTLRGVFPADASALAFAGEDALLLALPDGVERWSLDGRLLAVWRAPGRHPADLEVRGDRVLITYRDGVELRDLGGAVLEAHGRLADVEWRDALRSGTFREGAIVAVPSEGPVRVFGVERDLGSAELARFDRAGAYLLLGGPGEGRLMRWATGEARETWAASDAVAGEEAFFWVEGAHAGAVPLVPGGPEWTGRFHDPMRALARGAAHLYTGGERWVAARDPASGALRHVLPAGADAAVSSLAFGPGGRLAVGQRSGRLAIWETDPTPRRLALLDGTSMQPDGSPVAPGALGPVHGLAFAGEGLVVGLGGRLWRFEDALALDAPEEEALDGTVRASSGDGRRALVASWDRVALLVDGAERLTLARGGQPEAVALDPEGERFAVAFRARERGGAEIVLADAEGERRLRVDRPIETLAFDGGALLMGLAGMDTRSGATRLVRWDRAADAIETAAILPHAEAPRHLLAGGAPLVAGRFAWLEGHGALPATGRGITALARSDDGRRVAVGDDHGQVALHDLEAGRATLFGSTADGGWLADGAHHPGPHAEEGAT